MNPLNMFGQVRVKFIACRWLGFFIAVTASLFSGTAVSQVLAGEMLIEYRSFPGELESAQPSVSIQVYADGRIVAVYPAYMKRSGLWTGQLDSNELSQLTSDMAEMGVASVDMDNLKQEVAAARVVSRSDSRRFVTTDADLTQFIMPSANGLKTMGYRGLRSDSQQLNVAGLNAMAALEQRLLALAKNLRPGGLQ